MFDLKNAIDPRAEIINQTLLDSGVSDVSDVQPNDDATFADTPAMLRDVSGVSNNKIPRLEDRPKYLVFDNLVEEYGNKYRPGVWYFGAKAKKEGGEEAQVPIEIWICSPLHVVAITFDKDLNNFGRLLRFKTSIGSWREWPLPMEMLRGSGEEMRGILLSMGVEIDPSSRNQLTNYLQSQHPQKRVSCVTKTGWLDGNFVLPGEVIGKDRDSIIFQSNTGFFDEYSQGGTFDGWQELSRLAEGNPLLILALSAAFCGPMLELCGLDGGGIHLFGDSSTGKTTLLDISRSVWGGKSYRRSWRATSNGLEGAAALFNDNLLCLDEVSECDPSEVGKVVYSISNGAGKQRADRSGGARSLTRWKCFIISNGERTIETSIREGGRVAKAGQTVRLLDIPVARKFGAFDELHGLTNGAALSDKIKSITANHYGHAGRAFLEKVSSDDRDFRSYLDQFKSTPQFKSGDDGGQFKRAAARFALIALAGELSIEYRLLPGLSEGMALDAAIIGLNSWQSIRGKGGNSETSQILDQVLDFISRHGDSRFSNADGNISNELVVRDRAGWWRDRDGERVYLFTAAGLREAVKGFDFKRALNALEEVGALAGPDGSGERAKFIRINGRGLKLYPIKIEAE